MTEAAESSDLGGASGDLVESVETGAVEAIDAASSDPQSATN